MSSFFEFGKTTIKVPNKMIFVNKQGYDNLTNPITKSGAIASRFGIKSLNVEPTESNKIEVIESAPREVKPKPKAQRKPQQKKVNVKKEAEDLLSEMMGTKIKDKLEMPELPEPKKEKKVKKEPEPKKEKLYLDEILKIKKNFKELIDSEVLKNKYNSNYSIQELKAKYYKFKNKIKSIIEEMEINGFDVNEESSKLVKSGIIYMNIINKIEKNREKAKPEEPEPEPEPRDNIINEWESDTIPILLSQQDPEVYNNIEKKVNQLNKKNQYIVLNELGFYIEKYIDDLFKHYGENKKAVEIIINGLETIAQYIGANNINGYKYDGLLKWFNASNRQKVYKLYNGENASVTITNKKK